MSYTKLYFWHDLFKPYDYYYCLGESIYFFKSIIHELKIRYQYLKTFLLTTILNFFHLRFKPKDKA